MILYLKDHQAEFEGIPSGKDYFRAITQKWKNCPEEEKLRSKCSSKYHKLSDSKKLKWILRAEKQLQNSIFRFFSGKIQIDSELSIAERSKKLSQLYRDLSEEELLTLKEDYRKVSFHPAAQFHEN
ncbi:hypothetical protein RRG08_019067 [Elysia crispata]|uniref:Uncharacterized protein n=1 Tax=Elysia crispata TaxID=231223 RepID=A0AAE1DST7_9GAST|nr:hypothetical protein RRG08_019067 [Elysia crispata]